MNEREIRELADFLNLSSDEFQEKFGRILEGGIQLKDRGESDCIFLEKNHCMVYEARPLQCRTFPFWPENLKSAYRWNLVKQECPGIDQGVLFTFEQIQELLRRQNRRDSEK